MRTHAIALALLLGAHAASAEPTIRVSFPASTRATPASGRLVVYLIRPDADLGSAEPADAPFFENPQPMFGIDVRDLAPGAAAVIDDAATSFPGPLSKLPPGNYRAQAVLDMHRANSSWRREPGNLYSNEVVLTIGPDSACSIELTDTTTRDSPPISPGTELFEIRSKLLSDFRGTDVTLRAGVRLPVDRDPARPCAAVYEIPGFGGDHTHAFGLRTPYSAQLPEGSPWLPLRANAAWIVLDPEGPNGHHLFANSDNNGPVGDALVKELIPALEAKFNLIAQPSARLLRGHSSGGWSTLWLALNYPDTFGACWSSSPDPVDFRHFQLVNIYERKNFYRVEASEYPKPPLTGDLPDTPSYRARDRVLMTNRQECGMEQVLGPDNTSGQQWDSWFAAFGPRNERGDSAALYDPQTGDIDHAVAKSYRKFDIADLVRSNAGNYGLTFHQRIRLVVGDKDSFYLNEAVASLKAEVDKLSFFHYPEGRHGYIKVVPGDHGTVFGSEALRAFPAEMVEHLTRTGHIAEPK